MKISVNFQVHFESNGYSKWSTRGIHAAKDSDGKLLAYCTMSGKWV